MALPSYTETRYRIWHYIYLFICVCVFIYLIEVSFDDGITLLYRGDLTLLH